MARSMLLLMVCCCSAFAPAVLLVVEMVEMVEMARCSAKSGLSMSCNIMLQEICKSMLGMFSVLLRYTAEVCGTCEYGSVARADREREAGVWF